MSTKRPAKLPPGRLAVLRTLPRFVPGCDGRTFAGHDLRAAQRLALDGLAIRTSPFTFARSLEGDALLAALAEEPKP